MVLRHDDSTINIIVELLLLSINRCYKNSHTIAATRTPPHTCMSLLMLLSSLSPTVCTAVIAVCAYVNKLLIILVRAMVLPRLLSALLLPVITDTLSNTNTTQYQQGLPSTPLLLPFEP